MTAQLVAQTATALEWAKRLRPYALYPGVPFVMVPALVASLVLSQMTSSLLHLPANQVSAMTLPSEVVAGPQGHSQPLTLLMIPRDAGSFRLAGIGSGLTRAWLAIPPESLESHRSEIKLTPNGLELDQLFGMHYPLAVALEGYHEQQVSPRSDGKYHLKEFEVSTPEGHWIVLCLFGGALFGFGASSGSLQDAADNSEKSRRVRKRHNKRQN